MGSPDKASGSFNEVLPYNKKKHVYSLRSGARMYTNPLFLLLSIQRASQAR